MFLMSESPERPSRVSASPTSQIFFCLITLSGVIHISLQFAPAFENPRPEVKTFSESDARSWPYLMIYFRGGEFRPLKSCFCARTPNPYHGPPNSG